MSTRVIVNYQPQICMKQHKTGLYAPFKRDTFICALSKACSILVNYISMVNDLKSFQSMEMAPIQVSSGGHQHLLGLQQLQQHQSYQLQQQQQPQQQQQLQQPQPSVTPRHQVVAQLQQLQMQQKQDYFSNQQQQEFYNLPQHQQQQQTQQNRRRIASRDSSRWSLLDDENPIDPDDPGDQVRQAVRDKKAIIAPL